MDQFPSVILKPGKEAAVLRRHPWIFSGAIDKKDNTLKEGDIVEVFSSDRKFLATGHFMEGSIAVKVFSFLRMAAGFDFWLGRLKQAFELRRKIGLTDSLSTNAYRLVFSEGDEMPGLIIDWYNGVAAIQTHSLGMHNIKPMLVDALKELYGEKLVAVYDKSAETMARSDSRKHHQRSDVRYQIADGFLFQNAANVEILETGHKFGVDFVNGQKTGFFLDQRSNRMFAQFYAKDRLVLNTFCYSGAFTVYCLKGGATHVHSVDSSKQAIGWTKENLALNGLGENLHSEEVADVKIFLRETREKYNMIILDPPAFAKTHQVTNNALHAYVQLNASAIRRLEPGGLLFTFSCSQAISREMFRSALQAAAIETGRNVRILHHLSQGPDHPVSIYHPEGEYLKGLILEVE
ncbi:MAG: class I SAM-dependent rRNA methyltransferase [Bacteroidetes bacterium]|nr:class I SAM-dependent rRNA methyltransferase [Bacteroidota bacterium]